MEIRHYLQILSRRKWIVITTTIVTLAVVAVVTFRSPPVYTTSATVRIAQVQDSSIDYFDLGYSSRLINTYVELVRSRPFLEEAISRLELSVDTIDLAELVKAEAIPNTELLRIEVDFENASSAADLANMLGILLVEEGERLYSGQGRSAQEILFEQLTTVEVNLKANRDQLERLLNNQNGEESSAEILDLSSRISIQEQVFTTVLDAYESARLSAAARANSINIVEPAEIPVKPSGPSIVRNLLLGVLVGLAGGIGLALLVESFDLSIHSPADLEDKTEAPILGTIPELRVPNKFRDAPLLLRSNGRSAASEAFRFLSTNIHTLDFGRPPRSMLVTSVNEGAGKSTVVSNLAVYQAQSGTKVVAVDADLRDPSLHDVFQLDNDMGLKDVLNQGEDIESAIQKTKIPGVHILPSGPPSHNPAEALELPAMVQLVDDLVNWSDLVLLDSPPLSMFVDAAVLAPMVDGVLIVVARGKDTRDQIRMAIAQLEHVGASQIGLVFNRAEPRKSTYSYAARKHTEPLPGTSDR